MGWTVKTVVAAIVWMMNYVILSVDIVLMVAMMGILEHGVTHVINNNTSFVVMYFFWNVIYWLWLKSCGLSCDNVLKKIYFCQLKPLWIVSTTFILISLTQKNIIANIQDLNVIKRKFTNMLF